jgi:hypothetical protein
MEKQVLIEWLDESKESYLVTVAIDENPAEKENDDQIFFYFQDEAEYEKAKLLKNNGLEFRIIKGV